MNLIAFTLCLLLATGPVLAQLDPTARPAQPAPNPSMTVEDRGATLEVFPTKRAAAIAATPGRVGSHRTFAATEASPFGPQQLGVVFNHAMQSEGYITGEITFRLKGGAHPTGFDSTLYPGLAKLTHPNVYVLKARTPDEFVSVLKRLQGRPDVEWAEPFVRYGSVQKAPNQ